MSANKGPRVKFTLRMPEILSQKLARIAKAEGKTLNDWINEKLESK